MVWQSGPSIVWLRPARPGSARFGMAVMAGHRLVRLGCAGPGSARLGKAVVASPGQSRPVRVRHVGARYGSRGWARQRWAKAWPGAAGFGEARQSGRGVVSRVWVWPGVARQSWCGVSPLRPVRQGGARFCSHGGVPQIPAGPVGAMHGIAWQSWHVTARICGSRRRDAWRGGAVTVRRCMAGQRPVQARLCRARHRKAGKSI